VTPQQLPLIEQPAMYDRARLLAQVELPADVTRAIEAESGKRAVPWSEVFREWVEEGRV